MIEPARLIVRLGEERSLQCFELFHYGRLQRRAIGCTAGSSFVRECHGIVRRLFSTLVDVNDSSSCGVAAASAAMCRR